MHISHRLTVLALGAVTTIILGTVRGQVPAPAPVATPPPTAKSSAAVQAKPAAKAALGDLPADVFANPTALAGQPGAPDPAQAKKQEHFQKINQLTFDRRPSAILEAWSTPRAEAIKQPANAPNRAMPQMPARAMRALRNGAVNTVVLAPNTNRNMAVPGSMPNPARALRPTRSTRNSEGSSTTSR